MYLTELRPEFLIRCLEVVGLIPELDPLQIFETKFSQNLDSWTQNNENDVFTSFQQVSGRSQVGSACE
jgi:hypothetical protein